MLFALSVIAEAIGVTARSWQELGPAACHGLPER